MAKASSRTAQGARARRSCLLGHGFTCCFPAADPKGIPMGLFPTFLHDASLRRLSVTILGLTLFGCSHAPPADFAPDPGLVAQVKDIRIVTSYARACPGSVIAASYEAVLASGERVPFARSYDKKHPPRLHVVFLDRESPDAVSQEDGDWVTERDPLATVSTGFRLTATLRANSRVTSTVVVPPYYGCMPHTFTFSGEPGGAGEAGSNGPDVNVRLAAVRSPFYDKLYVAGFQAGVAPPFYILGDATSVAPADWLIVESRGGRGGTGIAGTTGTDGAAGAAGCPAQPGAPGGNGGNGGPGGSGGRGGRISIVVPIDQPLLAGLVEGLGAATGAATNVGAPGEATSSAGTVNSTVLLVVTRPNRTHVAPRVR